MEHNYLKTKKESDIDLKRQIIYPINVNFNRNEKNRFLYELKYTDYEKHFFEITIDKINRKEENIFYINKTFYRKYEIEELKSLSIYFEKYKTITEIFKEIDKCMREGQFELYIHIDGLILILTFSSFIDYSYKIPFYLSEIIQNNPKKINNHNKNSINNNATINKNNTNTNIVNFEEQKDINNIEINNKSKVFSENEINEISKEIEDNSINNSNSSKFLGIKRPREKKSENKNNNTNQQLFNFKEKQKEEDKKSYNDCIFNKKDNNK